MTSCRVTKHGIIAHHHIIIMGLLLYLLRELDKRDLRDEECGRVAGLNSGAEHEASHDVAVAADDLYRHVLPRLGTLHPGMAGKQNTMRDP